MQTPTLQDVRQAREVIAPYLQPTPLIAFGALSRDLDCQAYLKCENLQPVGAFKVRGGINLVASLSEEERRRGVITASTGNHGQSVAYAAQCFGVPATVLVPRKPNPLKVKSMRRLGAQVVEHGRDYDEALLEAQHRAASQGLRYIHGSNEPLLIAGVGTVSLEVMEQLADVEVIIVPVGGGSGAAGHCIVAKELDPAIQVIGVQAEQAPAVYHSWREKRIVELDSVDTFAEGLATRCGYELPLRILWERLDDMVLVSDDEMGRAILYLLETTHLLAEPAGAAATAAALKLGERLAGKRVVLILSGGNITLEQLRAVMDRTKAP
jgi:threonine dehydratase